jgi:hypothetical protein
VADGTGFSGIQNQRGMGHVLTQRCTDAASTELGGGGLRPFAEAPGTHIFEK